MSSITGFRKILLEAVRDDISEPGQERFIDYKFIEKNASLLEAFQALPKTDQLHIERSGIRIINPPKEFKVTNRDLEAIANTLLYAVANLFNRIGDDDAIVWINKITSDNVFKKLQTNLHEIISTQFNVDDPKNNAKKRAALVKKFIAFLAGDKFRDTLYPIIREYAKTQNGKAKEIAEMTDQAIATLIRASDIQVQSAFKRPEIICYDPTQKFYTAETPNSLDQDGNAYTSCCYEKSKDRPANSVRSTICNDTDILFVLDRSAYFTAMKESDPVKRLDLTILTLDNYIRSYLKREIELDPKKYVLNPTVKIDIFSLLSLLLKTAEDRDSAKQNEQINQLLSAILLFKSGESFEITVNDVTYHINVNVELFSLGTNALRQLSPEMRDKIDSRFFCQQITELNHFLNHYQTNNNKNISALTTFVSTLADKITVQKKPAELRENLIGCKNKEESAETIANFFNADVVSFSKIMELWKANENHFNNTLEEIRKSLGDNPNIESDTYKFYILMQDFYTIFYNFNHYYYHNLNSRTGTFAALARSFASNNPECNQYIHHAMVRISKALGHHPLVKCVDGKDRTTDNIITLQAEEQFKQEHKYYPRFYEEKDVKEYNEFLSQNVFRSAAFYTSAYACRFDPQLNSGAYGLQISRKGRPYMTTELGLLARAGKNIHPKLARKPLKEQKAREWLLDTNVTPEETTQKHTSSISKKLRHKISSLLSKAAFALGILGTFGSVLIFGNANANSDVTPHLQTTTILSAKVTEEARVTASMDTRSRSESYPRTVTSKELSPVVASIRDNAEKFKTKKAESAPPSPRPLRTSKKDPLAPNSKPKRDDPIADWKKRNDDDRSGGDESSSDDNLSQKSRSLDKFSVFTRSPLLSRGVAATLYPEVDEAISERIASERRSLRLRI